MSRALVDRVADAVLYEGYIFYPYRPSVKNRQRWTFGGLYPEAFVAAGRGGADSCANQTECLVEGGANTTVDVAVRFLHLTDRRVGAFDSSPPPAGGGAFRLVDTLRVGERLFHSWQEAEEREAALTGLAVAELLADARLREFSFPGRRLREPLCDDGGEAVGFVAREQQALAGAVEVGATPAGDGCFRLTVRVLNRTPFAGGGRDDALLRSLISAHTILGVRDGEFVSLLDPPENRREAAAACLNVGVWPVLAGEEGRRDRVLSSPIILYDYPQVAPESPGDFFDATEIDEMLTLRILTLTDDEKRAMASVDERARGLLERTEALARDQMLGLHGVLRGGPSDGEDGP